MSASKFLAVTAAIYNHILAAPTSARTAGEIHECWNEWPASPQPISLTLEALQQLEVEGEVERININGHELWRRAA